MDLIILFLHDFVTRGSFVKIGSTNGRLKGAEALRADTVAYHLEDVYT